MGTDYNSTNVKNILQNMLFKPQKSDRRNNRAKNGPKGPAGAKRAKNGTIAAPRGLNNNKTTEAALEGGSGKGGGREGGSRREGRRRGKRGRRQREGEAAAGREAAAGEARGAAAEGGRGALCHILLKESSPRSGC